MTVTLEISRYNGQWVAAFNGDFPVAIAGAKNVHEIFIKNNTEFNLFELYLQPQSPNIKLNYPRELRINNIAKGEMTFNCPADEDGPYFESTIAVNAKGIKAGA